jgi:hypothetical protein
MYRGKGKKNKKGHVTVGKSFQMCHCYKELENEEKWKTRDILAVPTSGLKTIDAQIIDDDDDDDATSEDGKRSPTPNSVTKSKRPMGRKLAKEAKKKDGEDELTKAVVAIVDARKEAAVAREMDREKDEAAEARKAAVEERKLALEEKKLAMEEN